MVAVDKERGLDVSRVLMEARVSGSEHYVSDVLQGGFNFGVHRLFGPFAGEIPDPGAC